jgi:hypothetical protein
VVVVGLKALDPEWPIREANDPKRHLRLVTSNQARSFIFGCSSNDCERAGSLAGVAGRQVGRLIAWMAGLALRHAMVVSLLANLASCVAGLLIAG